MSKRRTSLKRRMQAELWALRPRVYELAGKVSGLESRVTELVTYKERLIAASDALLDAAETIAPTSKEAANVRIAANKLKALRERRGYWWPIA